jgi:hypothetical protein
MRFEKSLKMSYQYYPSPNTKIKHFQKNHNQYIYQLLFALAFYLTYFKVQRQTFDHLIIDLCHPPNNVSLNMHNIYIILSCLHSIDGLVILQDITIQGIAKQTLKEDY